MNFKKGQLVKHRDNPNWKAVVLRDLNPRKPVNSCVVVEHNGSERVMGKSVLRPDLLAEMEKEFNW